MVICTRNKNKDWSLNPLLTVINWTRTDMITESGFHCIWICERGDEIRLKHLNGGRDSEGFTLTGRPAPRPGFCHVF